MKFWKHTLFTALAFFAITSMVLYSACQIDSCSDVQCLNGGSCANGFCNCPTGYEGAQCETKTSDKFVGTYIGNTSCNTNPVMFDTVTVSLQSAPLTMVINISSAPNSPIFGTISGNNIVIDDINNANYKRHMTVTLDGQKLIIYKEEESTDSKNVTTKMVCSFYGMKQ